MKKFENLQELWSYCQYCPVCRQACRNIDLSVVPDNFKLISYRKEERFLKLFCVAQRRKQEKYKINYIIDVITGKYSVEVLELIDAPTVEMNADTNLDEEEKHRLRVKMSKSCIFFYLNGDCSNCNNSYISTIDAELSGTTMSITGSSIGIEREGITILLPNDKYRLTILHDTGKTLINKCIVDKNSNILDDFSTFETSVVNFDFSNLEKVIHRIKTLITFS